MLSRVADSLFWMSRYLERAEHTARVLAVHVNLLLDQPREASFGRARRVRAMLGLEKAAQLPLADDMLSVAGEISFDLANRSSIVASIMSARDNARQVREQISSEMWEQMNRLFHEVRRADLEEFHEPETLEFLQAVKDGAHLFQGLTDSTMSHGDGWQFIQCGRFLERTISTAALVDAHFTEFQDPAHSSADSGPDSADYLEWIGLLKCATAFEAYCKVYTASIDSRRVAEFLLLNQEFPHALRFCVDSLTGSLAAIARSAPSRRSAAVERHAGRLRATLHYAHIDEIMHSGLHVFLQDLRRQAGRSYSALYQAYISYPIETALEV